MSLNIFVIILSLIILFSFTIYIAKVDGAAKEIILIKNQLKLILEKIIT